MNVNFNSLHGDIIRTGAVAGFILTETSYAPNLSLPKHSHQSPYFCFVLQGSFTERRGKQSHACGPSTLAFHLPGEGHSDHFHAVTRCFNLQMDARWVERVCGHSAMASKPAVFRGGLLAQLSTRLYREFRHMDGLSPLIIEGQVLEIMGEAARRSAGRPGGSPPDWLERARASLHDRFNEDLTLSKVAESVGVHKTHLAREFRRHYRCAVGEYVRRLRIEFACRHLSDSDAPLSVIALAAGFFDQSHFTRTFRRLTGLSPASYRKSLRAR